jgi:hypothetical protein
MVVIGRFYYWWLLAAVRLPGVVGAARSWGKAMGQ